VKLTRLRMFALGLVLVAPALVPALAGTSTSCAAAATGRPHAALVIDTGVRTTTYCVVLDAASVSGIRLIQLASAQYGLSYHLGFGSQAVCQLDGVGPNGGDCFSAYPDFWGYWHGASGGGWSWAGSGAASASVGDGSVEGWSFGAGDSGTTHAAPPSLRFSDVCDAPTATPDPPSPRPSPAGGGNAGGGAAGSGGGAGDASIAPSSPATPGARAPARPTSTPKVAPTPTPSDPSSREIIRAVATSGTAPSNGGPPAGAIAVAGAVIALGTAGALTLRRRQKQGRA
jgi:hypothetical protein